MSSTSSGVRKRRRPFLLQKPRGVLTARVQAVGAEHFGIVAIDCAKARSRYLLADFFGQVLLPPQTVAHSRGELQAAIDRVRQAQQQHGLGDLIVAIERTGEYHRPVQQAFRAAGYETRLVHPYAAKQYRQPADLANKTDDTDLAGIFRATTHGFGLLQPEYADDVYPALQLLRRHRHDLVCKHTALCCQIREALHALMPGYADCFSHLWESAIALLLARQTGSAQAVLQAGVDGLQRLVRAANLHCQHATLLAISAWAADAPPAHPHAEPLRRILDHLDDDRLQKAREIRDSERTLAHLVVRTSYIVLLAIPGINIVTCADLAGEVGPIDWYANANAITGRAALMPCRYQSDQVDYHGGLRRGGNRRLRAVLMQTADNLADCNDYFRARTDRWRRLGKDPRWIRVKIAKIFSRLLIAMVAGRQLFPHPCCHKRHYILGKLLKFLCAHGTEPAQTHQDLEHAIAQLPKKTCAEEAKPIAQHLDDLAHRRRGPQPLADILPLVLARLGARQLQSTSEGRDPG